MFRGTSCAAVVLVLSGTAAEGQTHSAADSLRAAAVAYLAAGDTASAITTLRDALAADPVHGPAGGDLLTLLDNAGRTSEALALGDWYRRYGPPNPRLLFRYGWVFGFLWENDAAVDLYTDLAVIDSGGTYESWSYGELSYLAKARGEGEEAVRLMRIASERRPTDGFSQVGLAQMLLNAGRANEALPILEREIAARDTLARGYGAQSAHVLLGWAYMQLGDTAAAQQVLTAAAERVARTASPTRLMQVYAVQGRIEEALAIAARLPYINLYGSPDPRDGMLAPLRGRAEYEALLARSRTLINEKRAAVGLPPIEEPAAP